MPKTAYLLVTLDLEDNRFDHMDTNLLPKTAGVNCGFVDLRRYGDGKYRCRVCGKEMPPYFLSLLTPADEKKLKKFERS